MRKRKKTKKKKTWAKEETNNRKSDRKEEVAGRHQAFPGGQKDGGYERKRKKVCSVSSNGS